MGELIKDGVLAFDRQADTDQSVVGCRDDDRPERRVMSFVGDIDQPLGLGALRELEADAPPGLGVDRGGRSEAVLNLLRRGGVLVHVGETVRR